MTIEERAEKFARDFAPYSDHTNLEIGYKKGAEEQKNIDIERACNYYVGVLYKLGHILMQYTGARQENIDDIVKHDVTSFKEFLENCDSTPLEDRE